MQRIYFLLPILATSLCAAYYHHWEKQQALEQAALRSRPPVVFDPYEAYAKQDGAKDAKADLAKGTPRLLTYGLPVHWIREFGVVLMRDYGVDQQSVAGCVVSESLVKYTAAYNAGIEDHLRKVHGANVMEEVARKAEALYAQRHPPAPETIGAK